MKINWKLFILSLSFVIFLFSGCTPSEQPDNLPTITEAPTDTTIIPTLQPTQEIVANPTFPIPTEENPGPIIPEYKLKVDFDYSIQTAQISEQIIYTNNSDLDLDTIILACDPLRYPGSFSLINIQVNGVDQSDVTIGNYFLEFKLSENLAPGNKVDLQIDYELQVPPLPPPADDRKPGIFGYSTVQTNFVDWYPFIPPLTSNGEWLLHEPWFYGEYLVYDLANFQVEIDMVKTPLNTSIAASTNPVNQNDNNYQFISTSARNFAWSLSPSYLIETKTVNDITVTSYTFPFHQQAGLHVLNESVKAIELYSKLFSPYPRKNLSIVEADFLDGMEYDGLYFLSRGFYNLFDNSPQNYLTAIAVHETAHQWWYSSIANDQAIEPWLDEALCTYSELLFYEEYYPDLVDWWWEYRVNYYQPDDLIDKPIYDYQGFVPYRNATYLQGAKFLHTLRQELGDDNFFKFLKNYASSQSNRIASQKNFFDVLSQYLDEDSKILLDYFSILP